MSREIKFRQWMGDRFRYWGFIGEGKATSFSSPVDQDIKSDQYTGLKDKNGVGIYEGDIVTWGFGSTVVKFGEWYVDDDGSEKGAGWIVEDCFLDSKCKVIGNIYENPDLIK